MSKPIEGDEAKRAIMDRIPLVPPEIIRQVVGLERARWRVFSLVSWVGDSN